MDKLRRTLATRPSGGKSRCLPWRLLLTDAVRLADPLPAIARLPKGSAVILRHYEWPPGRRLALARRIRAVCRQRGLLLLVAGDSRLALASGADGVHLPQGLLSRARGARRLRRWLVTAAAHDAGALAIAARQGVDAVLLSPVFATPSHPGAGGLGVMRFAALADAAWRQGLAVYALGGVRADTASRLRHIRIAGLAGIGS